MSDFLILYVDDERANRVVFEQTFKNRFPIRCVAGGEEALEALRDGNVAVLVTDQRMPGMTGQELLEATRAKYPDVIRIVLTAYGDIDPILRAVNDGLVSRYLVKPWDRAELEQILTWSLEAHALARHDSALQLRLMQTERLVTIGSIGAAVLHDLQQPLASLRLNIVRLAEHADVVRGAFDATGSPSTEVSHAIGELPELVEDLGLAVEVMQGIVQHLRGFLRPDSAAPPSDNPADVGIDPLPIIRYASSVCREISARVLGQIICEGSSTLPRVSIGATELTQVLINLIANAANSLTKEGRVIVTTSVDGDGVRFVIADNGVGMSPEVLRKAGTPFFSTRANGTGLGLSQCHRLLGAVGSRLEIESQVGSGTTARFTVKEAIQPANALP
jgi:signal transduction histidine kinase